MILFVLTGCTLLGFDPYPSDEMKALGMEYVERDDLFRRSDVIVLTAPLTPQTKHMVNAETLKLFKKGSVLINTGRGPLIDTKTLVGGRAYIVVWSPHNHMGKYALQVGHRWPFRWTYWAQIPWFWWQIRGWFGLSRAAAYATGGLLLAGGVLAVAALRARMKRNA